MPKIVVLGIGIVGVTLSILVVKNSLDIHRLAYAVHALLYKWDQEQVDEEFVSLVERELGDLDEE